MSTATKTIKDAENGAGHEFADELENLKSSFAQLRTDVSSLLDSATDAGKSGARAVRSQASDVIDGLKDKGAESLEAVEGQMEDYPVTSALVAFGVGFVLAKVLFSR